jgi:tetratricopeptide (TPR) repeat protein
MASCVRSWAGVVALFALTGCNHGTNAATSDTTSNQGGDPKGSPPSYSRVDDIDNDKLIAWLKTMADTRPGAGGRSKLINIYTKRGQMRGRLDDFEACIHYSGIEIAQQPTGGAYRARARCEMSLHKYAAAAADLDEAPHHPDSNEAWETLAMRGDVDLALGRYDEARKLYLEAIRPKDPSVLVRLANLDVELGNFAEANRGFEDAEKRANGLDPSYEAWLQVQRAIRHEESGELDLASARIDRALALDPKNVLAQQHHAQLLAWTGHPDEAGKIYRPLIEKTDNPEFMSKLALLLEASPDGTAEAARLVDQARVRYKADLAAFPEALWQHDGTFLLDHGIEPAEALDVLKKDAAARPAVADWIPLAWAQLANADVAGAQTTMKSALATPVKSARLFWTAAAVSESAGMKEDAAKFRKQALAIDPKVGVRMAPWARYGVSASASTATRPTTSRP